MRTPPPSRRGSASAPPATAAGPPRRASKHPSGAASGEHLYCPATGGPALRHTFTGLPAARRKRLARFYERTKPDTPRLSRPLLCGTLLARACALLVNHTTH